MSSEEKPSCWYPNKVIVNKAAIIQFFAEEFPHHDKIIIDEVGHQSARLRHTIGPKELRPGNSVAGPILMLLADVSAYVAILSTLGQITLAVTTSLNINFLRKPSADHDLIAECQLIKTGKILVVAEIKLYSEGQAEPVAHCVATYALPPTEQSKKRS